MSENEILAFRMILSEEGAEMTPDQAKKAYFASKSIMKTSRMMSMIDFWDLEDNNVEGMTEKERNEMSYLYKNAKDL